VLDHARFEQELFEGDGALGHAGRVLDHQLEPVEGHGVEGAAQLVRGHGVDVAAAEAEIQSATIFARREIQKYAAELAIEQAARKLVVTAETDRLLVESFAHRLGEGSKN